MIEDTDYTLQFPYIILKDTVSVEKNTTLTLTAETDESLKRSGTTATTTLARPRLELVLPAWGNVVIPTVSSFTGGHNVLIFDSEGNLTEYGTVSSTIMEETYSYTSDKLKAGSYTAVIFNQNQYLSVIPALSGLTSCGMTEDADYKKINFTIRDKETTAIDTVTVADIWLDTNIKAHNFIPAEYWKSNFRSVKEALLLAEQSGDMSR